MLSFENKLNKLFNTLPEKLMQQEAYLVNDLFTRFSLYIVEPTDDIFNEIVTSINKALSGLISAINIIDRDGFIYHDLQINKERIGDKSSKLFFVNRHVDKTNWYLSSKDRLPISAHIVAFYSFKGGLGRTTALVLSALQLARQGKRVALVDFDLEAPGLGPLFLPDYPHVASVRGTADFFLDWQSRTPSISDIDINDYYFTINQQALVGNNNGELYVFPASYSDASESSINYIDKLSKVNLQFDSPLSEEYGPDALFTFIDHLISPDYIFIDTRTGINDIGGLVLQRYANSAFLFFQGNTQNMFGLEALLPKIKAFDIPFYLVNSPTPRDPALREQEIDYFLNTSYQIFANNYYSSESLPDIYDATAEHYPINIPYNDIATFLNNTTKLQAILEDRDNPYNIISNLTATENSINITKPANNYANTGNANISAIVEAISRVINNTAASEEEFKSENDLRINFYPRNDYRFIFDRNKLLVLGEKGSGKTALYAVLSHEKYARELAKFCGVNSQEWQHTTWIKGLDTTSRYPGTTNFKSLQNLTDDQLRNYWILLLGKEIGDNSPINVPNFISEKRPFSHLKKLAQSGKFSEQIEEYLTEVDNQLFVDKRYITVVYDYLDLLLTEEQGLRGRLVGALLRLWYEYHNRFTNLRAKIFLRKDIYDREIPPGLTDKVKLDNFKQEIEWNPPQLLNMVWKRIIERAPDDTKAFIAPATGGIDLLPHNSTLGYIPTLNQDQHTKLLEQVFGKRMGSNNKAFPYKWIEQHISDTFRHIQPRSMLNLFGLGARRQMEDISKSSTLIRPQNFEAVLGEVSARRVRDLEEEYPGLKSVFSDLKEHLSQFPVQESELMTALTNIRSKHDSLTSREVKDILQELIDVGVLYEYKFNKTVTGTRYHIPDLYLFGLGLRRKGPGAQKNIFDYQRRASRRSQ